MRLYGKTGLVPVTLAIVLLAGCAWLGVERPSIESPSDAIAVTSADITAVATQVQVLCGNTSPGGPCAEGALLDTATKDSLKRSLQDVQDTLVLANAALNVNDQTGAEDNLRRAQSLLELVRDELARRQRGR